jgi:phosphoglycolate phosphatase
MVTDEYDFWLFDLDGTLIDAEWGYIRDVFDTAGQRLDYAFSDREAEIIWHGLGGQRDSLLREIGVEPAAFWTAFHEIEAPDERAAASRLHDDAAVLLASLDTSTPVGLVTHCQQFLTEPVLDALDLDDAFDTVVCCDETVGWKPDPTPVRRAMAELGVDESHRGVLAGDAAVDIGAAWNAGLDGIHVERHGHARRGRCVRGDYRVQSLTELLPATAADGGIDRETESS